MDSVGCLGATILTNSGRYFDFVDIQADQIDIRDIAAGLGKTCRYGGQCGIFYSVAEHSILAMEQAMRVDPEDPEFHLAALLHDAAEAYVGDMPKPLKNLLPEFEKIEDRVEAAIFDHYDVNDSYKGRVKEIDLQMLKAEKVVLFPDGEELWTGFENIPPITPRFRFYKPGKAVLEFLNTYGRCLRSRKRR